MLPLSKIIIRKSLLLLSAVTLSASLMSASVLAADFDQTLDLANQGSSNAQFNLGLMYYEGDGVPQYYNKALSWFKKAVKDNDPLI